MARSPARMAASGTAFLGFRAGRPSKAEMCSGHHQFLSSASILSSISRCSHSALRRYDLWVDKRQIRSGPQLLEGRQIDHPEVRLSHRRRQQRWGWLNQAMLLKVFLDMGLVTIPVNESLLLIYSDGRLAIPWGSQLWPGRNSLHRSHPRGTG
jgi:hypothetical protein